MLPERRPTTSNPPPRDTFDWPPSTAELDAIEVIVLDDAPPARQSDTRPRRVDVAHWGLTLTSLLAIAVSLALQLVNWHGTPAVRQDAPVASAAPAPQLVASPIQAVASTPFQAVSSPLAVSRRAPAPAFVPVRKPHVRERAARAAIDSPPLRLPESYVQPRLVSSGDGRVRGTVVLGVQVRANGRIGDVDVLSDDRDGRMERAAIAAVKQWRYRPALRDGVPTPARLKVIVKFS